MVGNNSAEEIDSTLWKVNRYIFITLSFLFNINPCTGGGGDWECFRERSRCLKKKSKTDRTFFLFEKLLKIC